MSQRKKIIDFVEKFDESAQQKKRISFVRHSSVHHSSVHNSSAHNSSARHFSAHHFSLTTCYVLFFCIFLLSSCTKTISLPERPTADPVAQWEQSLVGKSPAEKLAMANAVLSNNAQPLPMRERATSILASIHNPQTSSALASLATSYKAASQMHKIYLEEILFSDLQQVSNNDIYQNLSLITPELEAQFPYVLVIYVAAQRNLLQNSHAIVERLASPTFFQSPKLIGKPQETGKVSSGAIAVLLPHSGNIAPIAKEITAGIEAARGYLQSFGSNWQVYYIDSEDPGWLPKIQALPANCVTIGGPLQTGILDQLKKNDVHKSHAIFSFVPRLPQPQDEGVILWQFFTKPDDQINAMINTASQGLGVTQFGVFAPMTPYGTSMTELFTKIALSKGFQVKSAQYPTGEVKEWSKTAQQFLDSYVPNKKKPPVVRAPIEAIFLPDAWRNIDFLISTMHYHGAHKKIMLGSSLWEQSLNQNQNINATTFGLTIFPVAYDKNQDTQIHTLFTQSIANLNVPANDWSSLGFDFMIMASELNLSQMQSASSINQRLNSLQLNYVAAPFKWDHNGIAHRFLFINQPSREGRVPFDLPSFLEYKDNKGPLPNKSQAERTQETLKAGEENALDEVDALINDIVNEDIQ